MTWSFKDERVVRHVLGVEEVIPSWSIGNVLFSLVHFVDGLYGLSLSYAWRMNRWP